MLYSLRSPKRARCKSSSLNTILNLVAIHHNIPEWFYISVRKLVYLQTCRRLSEVASLLWRDVQIDTQTDAHGTVQELVTLTFERCKGAKVMMDQLPVGIRPVLLLGDLSPPWAYHSFRFA